MEVYGCGSEPKATEGSPIVRELRGAVKGFSFPLIIYALGAIERAKQADFYEGAAPASDKSVVAFTVLTGAIGGALAKAYAVPCDSATQQILVGLVAGPLVAGNALGLVVGGCFDMVRGFKFVAKKIAATPAAAPIRSIGAWCRETKNSCAPE
jgi:hypothetical protein